MKRIVGEAGRRGPLWFEIEWLWEPRDLWIGLYWKRSPRAVEFYLCLIPTLPLRVYLQDQR